MTMPEKKKISIVVPVYNEEETLDALYARVLKVMDWACLLSNGLQKS